MVTNQILLLHIIISVPLLSIGFSNYHLVNIILDFCYDEVGDGHYCFEKMEKCEYAEKDDQIAETPCYSEDLI